MTTTTLNGHARAITMWDFSWLERRWAGAGYEDWDKALSELAERGYDSVRIDAYPHLIHTDPDRVWTLLPAWNQMAWGAQSIIKVQVLPQLLDFLRAADRHDIAVGLSTWFRRDFDDVRMHLDTPDKLADAWISTLNAIEAAGLLHTILYVDLCNEFPLSIWAPFLYGREDAKSLPVTDPRLSSWMQESIGRVRAAHPDQVYTYSFTGGVSSYNTVDVQTFDLLEPHLWMAGESDYYKVVGYTDGRFEASSWDNVVARGREIYLTDQAKWDSAIFTSIDEAAAWSKRVGKPLATTECWSIIDYKDWPGLAWDWVNDLNERAVARAAATGRWTALATSNFCGPQFVELWRDVPYHQRLTKLIHSAPVDDDLRS